MRDDLDQGDIRAVLRTGSKPQPTGASSHPLRAAASKRDGGVVRIEQAANLHTAGMQALGQFDLRHTVLFQQSDDHFLDRNIL